jgi:hypothetical protein
MKIPKDFRNKTGRSLHQINLPAQVGLTQQPKRPLPKPTTQKAPKPRPEPCLGRFSSERRQEEPLAPHPRADLRSQSRASPPTSRCAVGRRSSWGTHGAGCAWFCSDFSETLRCLFFPSHLRMEDFISCSPLSTGRVPIYFLLIPAACWWYSARQLWDGSSLISFLHLFPFPVWILLVASSFISLLSQILHMCWCLLFQVSLL